MDSIDEKIKKQLDLLLNTDKPKRELDIKKVYKQMHKIRVRRGYKLVEVGGIIVLVFILCYVFMYYEKAY